MRKRNASGNEDRIAARSKAAGDARVETAQRMSVHSNEPHSNESHSNESCEEPLIRGLFRRGRFRLDA